LIFDKKIFNSLKNVSFKNSFISSILPSTLTSPIVDFKLLNKLKDVYGEKRIKHLSKYSQIGLSRQRVIEASWLLKKYLGDYRNIKTVNYTVNAKDKKGFIV